MQSYNKLFIKQLFFNTENGDEVRLFLLDIKIKHI